MVQILNLGVSCVAMFNQPAKPNWGLHLTPLCGAGEAGRYVAEDHRTSTGP